MNDRDIEQLWEDYLHGTLSEADERSLLAALREDEDLGTRFLDDLELHGVLMHGSVDPDQFEAGFRESLRAEADGQTLVDSIRRKLVGKRAAPIRIGKRRMAPMFFKLAAAAVVAVGIGVVIRLGTSTKPEYALGRITRTVGQFTAMDWAGKDGTGTDIQTGGDSFCRVEQSDGSAIGVDQRTELAWRDYGIQRGREVELKSGRAYFDLAKQTRPLVVTAGDVKGEVLGTQFLVSRSGIPSLSLLEGAIRARCMSGSTILYAGQTATAGSPPSIWSLFVHNRPIDNDSLSWVDRIGFDSRTVGTGFGLGDGKTDDGLINVGTYRVSNGAWKIERRAGKLVIAQEDRELGKWGTPFQLGGFNFVDEPSWNLLAQENHEPGVKGGRAFKRKGGFIVLGEPCWKKGVFSVKCRLLSKPIPLSSFIHLAVGWTTNEGMSTPYWPIGDLASNSVLAMRMEFEVDAASGKFEAKQYDCWPDGRPDQKRLSKGNGFSFSTGTGPCALGFGSTVCAVEFFDLSLTEAVRAEPDVRVELLPWVTEYYKRHNQFVLQRENFVDGEVLDVLTPAQLRNSGCEGTAELKVIRRTLKDGKEGDALSIDNMSMSYYVSELRFRGGLPESFAVEIDMLATDRAAPSPGISDVSPFLYEWRPAAGDRRSKNVLVSTPDSSSPQEILKAAARPLNKWSQYRAEYFRVGRLSTGEVLHELRLPSRTSEGVSIDWKRDDSIVISLRGIKIQLGEVRLRRLISPAGLGAPPTGPAVP